MRYQAAALLLGDCFVHCHAKLCIVLLKHACHMYELRCLKALAYDDLQSRLLVLYQQSSGVFVHQTNVVSGFRFPSKSVKGALDAILQQ